MTPVNCFSHADEELIGIHSSPCPAIRSQWLKSQAQNVMDPSSSSTLVKFNIMTSPTASHSSAAVINSSQIQVNSGITFGKFVFPTSLGQQNQFWFGSFKFDHVDPLKEELPTFKGQLFQ